MRKFAYNIKNKKSIVQIENEYIDLVFSEVKKDLNLNNNKYDNILKIILKSDIDYLLSKKNYIHSVFKNYSIPKDKFYNKLQSKISDFISENFNFKICPYCGIEHINSYKDSISYYADFKDFIINASEIELTSIKDIGTKTAKKIINDRELIYMDKPEDFFSTYIKFEKNFNSYLKNPKTYNHYTLDHILAKSEYKLYQISLYNLLPCCYNCNCKIKGTYNLKDNAIFNSKHYNLDNEITFKLISSMDNDLKIIANYDTPNAKEYLEKFRITGRYNFHIDNINDLKHKAIKYNQQKIEEISNQTGISIQNVKELIFGKEIFESNSDVPLYKLKIDIAKELNIL